MQRDKEIAIAPIRERARARPHKTLRTVSARPRYVSVRKLNENETKWKKEKEEKEEAEEIRKSTLTYNTYVRYSKQTTNEK